jgi:NADH dehydrogenase FAD-containing subunit
MQMGRHATKNILFLIRGDKSKPFRYFDKGSMGTIGRQQGDRRSQNLLALAGSLPG